MSTRAETAYLQLKSDILSGRLQPSSRLRFADLTERYAVSSGVLREVLPRLLERGLVDSKAQSGFSVVARSAEDLREINEARVLLEPSMLKLSIRKGDWESLLLAAYHLLHKTDPVDESGNVSDDWQRAHVAFYEALLAGCANERLMNMAARLRDSTEIYRFSAWGLLDQSIDLAEEHSALLKATVERDENFASELLAGHIDLLSSLLLKVDPRLVGEDAASLWP